jgi:hypothetical protein
MRSHAFTLSLMLVACGGSEVAPLDPVKNEFDLSYDDSRSNLKALGNLLGEEVQISEVTELEAVREYDAPAIPGTEDPDVSEARLVSIEVKGIAMRDGVPWEVQLDIEGEDLGGFGVGAIAPYEELEISFQLENEELEIDLEDAASSGSVEIKRYDAAGQNDEVKLGGSIGGVFDILLMSGDRVSGAFFAPFGDPEIDVD